MAHICVVAFGLLCWVSLCDACSVDMENATCTCSENVLYCSGDITQQNLTTSSGAPNNLDLNASTVNDIPITSLSFRQNHFTNIPVETLKLLPTLISLDLSENFIEIVNRGDFESVQDLEYLDLNQNLLHTVEAYSFETLSRLVHLNLNRNNFSVIDDNAFQGLKSLRQLNLSTNYLLHLSQEMFLPLTSLEHLDVSYNKLSDIVETKISLPSLQFWDLQGNDLTGQLSADDFQGVPKLLWINLAGNRLQGVLPDAMRNLGRLLMLDLSYNNIDTLSNQSFSNLWSLTSLNLKGNAVRTIEPFALYNLTQLRILDLGGNLLEYFTCLHSISLVNLDRVFLNENNLRSLGKGAFRFSANLAQLELNGNSLECDCNLQSFADYLRNSHTLTKNSSLSAICQSPTHLFHKPVVDVDFAALNCPKDTLATTECNTNDVSPSKVPTLPTILTTLGSDSVEFLIELRNYELEKGELFMEWWIQTPVSDEAYTCNLFYTDTGSMSFGRSLPVMCPPFNTVGPHQLSVSLPNIQEGIQLKICFIIYLNRKTLTKQCTHITTEVNVTYGMSSFDTVTTSTEAVDLNVTLTSVPLENGTLETVSDVSTSLQASPETTKANDTSEIFSTVFHVNESAQHIIQMQWEVSPNISSDSCTLRLVFYHGNNNLQDTRFFSCSDGQYTYVSEGVQAGEVYRVCLLLYHRILGTYYNCTELHPSQDSKPVRGTSPKKNDYAFVLLMGVFMIVVLVLIVITVKFLISRRRKKDMRETVYQCASEEASLNSLRTESILFMQKRDCRQLASEGRAESGIYMGPTTEMTSFKSSRI